MGDRILALYVEMKHKSRVVDIEDLFVVLDLSSSVFVV